MKMDMDTALERLGTFGKWQFGIFIIISFTKRFPAFMNILATVYIGHAPEHHCKIAELAFINDSIPRDSNGKLSQCLRYVNLSLSNQTMGCDDGWDYDPNDSYTIVNEWNLVCDRRILSDVPQTIIFIGMNIGSFIASIFSDIFGRKKVFLTSQMLILVLGTGSAFIENFNLFLVSRFILGMIATGVYVPGCVFLFEMFPTKHRSFIGINNCIFTTLAITTMPVFAFLLPNWRNLQIFTNLFGILSIPLFWYMPESVRWLHANNRTKEAEEVIRFAARINNIEMPDVILENVDSKNEEINFKEKKSIYERIKYFCSKIYSKNESAMQYSTLDLFRNSMLRRHLAVVSFLWTVNAFVFYGLIYTSGDLLGNRFINGFFNGLVEIPAIVISYQVIRRYGRKIPLSGFLLMATTFLLIIPFVLETTVPGTDVYLSTIFSILAKFAISGSFYIKVIFIVELFPTNLRSRAMGISIFISMVGYTGSSFMDYFMKQYMGYVFIAFGIFAFLAALSVQLLPESHNRPLPDTIEEIEAWKHKATKDSSEPDEKSHVLSEESKENENKYVTSTE